MFRSAILVIPIDIDEKDIEKILENAGNYVENRIFVQIHSDYQNLPYEKALPKLSQLATKIYGESSKKLPGLDIIVQIGNFRGTKALLEVDVILFGMDKVSQQLRDSLQCHNQICIEEDIRKKDLDAVTEETHDTVVLGGTFDRLHAGHKILLTQSVLRAKNRVVVGVTDEGMIRKGKVLSEIILPVEKRIQDVLNFLRLVDNSLNYEVVPISDPFGPTATDPDMDMIVVSDETYRGGQKVNELRAKNGLKELLIYKIPLVDHSQKAVTDTELNVNEQKVSSSRGRYDLLGKYIKSGRKITERISQNCYLVGVFGEELLNELKAKEIVVLELKESLIQNYSGLVFVSLENSMEVELLDKCQEIWCCLSSENFLNEKTLEIADILFTSSIPIGPQLEKALEKLHQRSA